MAHDELELQQAEQLDKVVSNIITSDRDLFQGTESGSLPRETMELIDLATFIIPSHEVERGEFEQRMYAVALRESRQQLSQGTGSTQDKASKTWSWLTRPVAGMGLATAAFFAALFMEPMPRSRCAGSIDTPSRQWYNYQMDRYAISPDRSDVGQVLCLGFSVGSSVHRAAECR